MRTEMSLRVDRKRHWIESNIELRMEKWCTHISFRGHLQSPEGVLYAQRVAPHFRRNRRRDRRFAGRTAGSRAGGGTGMGCARPLVAFVGMQVAGASRCGGIPLPCYAHNASRRISADSSGETANMPQGGGVGMGCRQALVAFLAWRSPTAPAAVASRCRAMRTTRLAVFPPTVPVRPPTCRKAAVPEWGADWPWSPFWHTCRRRLPLWRPPVLGLG
jgi:hypothetical protein